MVKKKAGGGSIAKRRGQAASSCFSQRSNAFGHAGLHTHKETRREIVVLSGLKRPVCIGVEGRPFLARHRDRRSGLSMTTRQEAPSLLAFRLRLLPRVALTLTQPHALRTPHRFYNKQQVHEGY